MSETPNPASMHRAATRAFGSRVIPGLVIGHSVFHWITQSFVVVLPEIQQAFQLSGVGVGGILAARELASGLVTLPGGVAVDVLRRHWGSILVACLVASALGSLVIGTSPAYSLLLVGMVIVAVAHSIWHLPASASLAHHFRHRRGMGLAFHGVGGGVGDVAGPVVTGALLAFLTWREVLSIYAAAPLLLGAAAVWAFRGIGPDTQGGERAVALSERIAITKRLLGSPVLGGLALVYGLRTMALVALITVLPLYLGSDLALSPASRGFHIGLLIAVGLVTKPMVGYLSDRLGRKQVLVPGLVWSTVLVLMLIPFDRGVPLTIAVALLGLFLYPDQPVLTAAVFDLVGHQVANTGLGMVSFAGAMMGTVSPLVAGALYERMGFDSTAYYIAALFALSALFFLLLPLSKKAGLQQA